MCQEAWERDGVGTVTSLHLLLLGIPSSDVLFVCLPFLPPHTPADAVACLREVHGLHALPVLPPLDEFLKKEFGENTKMTDVQKPK